MHSRSSERSHLKEQNNSDQPDLKNNNLCLEAWTAFLALGGAASTGIVSAAQYLSAIQALFRTNNDSYKLPVTIIAIFFSGFNFGILNFQSNQKIFKSQKKSRIKRLKKLMQHHPFELFLVTFPASFAENLIAAGCTVSMLGQLTTLDSDVRIYCAIGVGLFAQLQYLCLESKELIEQVENRFKMPPLDPENTEKCLSGLCLVGWTLAILGALGTGSLAYVEGRDLIESLMMYVLHTDHPLAHDWASVIAVPLSTIYGVVHFSLFGYRWQAVRNSLQSFFGCCRNKNNTANSSTPLLPSHSVTL